MTSFNSREYAWSNLQVLMLGRIVTKIRAIEYDTEREKDYVYAAGDDPHAIQYGNKKYSGTLTLLQSELEAMTRYAIKNGYDDVTDFDFDVVVTYVSKEGVTVTDTVLNASVTKIPKGMKQGDKFMEGALPFMALGVKRSG
jgi:hypothetical protein